MKNKLITILVLSILLKPINQLSASDIKNNSSTIVEQKVINIDIDNFYKTIQENDKPVIVDFYGELCGPCQKIKPIFEQLAIEYSDKYVFASINLTENTTLAEEFKIRSVPAFFVFKNGKVLGKFFGFCSKEQLISRIEESLEHSEEIPFNFNPADVTDFLESFRLMFQNNDLKKIQDFIDKTNDLNKPINIFGQEKYILELVFGYIIDQKDGVNLLIKNGAEFNSELIAKLKSSFKLGQDYLDHFCQNLNYLERLDINLKSLDDNEKIDLNPNNLIREITAEENTKLVWELIGAAANNNIEEVKKLISMGANLNHGLKINDELPKVCPLYVIICCCRNNDLLDAIHSQHDLDLNPKMEMPSNTADSTIKHMSLKEWLAEWKQNHLTRIKTFESYIN
jgi:thioredoxin 1